MTPNGLLLALGRNDDDSDEVSRVDSDESIDAAGHLCVWLLR